MRGEEIIELLNARQSVSTSHTPIGDYGATIVRTYAEWEDDVDSIIEAASPTWALDRMTIVERSVLRIGAVELMYLDVDLPIVVKEVNSLVREFSEEKAIKFTTGILNRISEIYTMERSGLEDHSPAAQASDTQASATKGRVFVVAGASGVGKGTVLRELRSRYPELWYSVSVTTRDPRPGEVDGVDYHFVSDAEFDCLIERDELLEYAVVHGMHRYGTLREPVIEASTQGKIAILELDLAGARQVRKSLPEAEQIFILPPSFEELEARLVGRGTESAQERSRRLETAREEIAAQDEFDYVITNSTVAQATDELINIMHLNG